LSLIIQ